MQIKIVHGKIHIHPDSEAEILALLYLFPNNLEIDKFKDKLFNNIQIWYVPDEEQEKDNKQ